MQAYLETPVTWPKELRQLPFPNPSTVALLRSGCRRVGGAKAAGLVFSANCCKEFPDIHF